MEVMKVPARTRSTTKPLAASERTAARARMPSSKLLVPPRLLTISATRRPPASQSTAAAADPSAQKPMICVSIISTVSSAVRMAHRRAPGSPWIPRPSSISPAGSSKLAGRPGTTQGDSDTPIVPTRSAVALAAAATSAKLAPRSAAAPAGEGGRGVGKGGGWGSDCAC